MLALEAVCVDTEKDLDAVACPFGDLGCGYPAVEPGGKACVAQIVGSAGERGLVLLVRQRHLACPVLCSPIGDGGQRATLHAPEKRVGRGAAELGEVVAEQRGEGWRAGNRPAFTLGPVLQAAVVTISTVVSPLSPGVWPGRSNVEFCPCIIGLRRLPGIVVACEGGKFDVLAAEADGFLGPQAAVVEDSEEGNQPGAAGWLRPDCSAPRTQARVLAWF